jgi:hypothetical protein
MEKIKLNYEKIRKILEDKESARLNCTYILMDFKPYRKSIFLQILGKRNFFEKNWKNLNFKEKMLWIEQNMFTKWDKYEFTDHIIKAMVMFEKSEFIKKSFVMALEVNLKEEIQNV